MANLRPEKNPVERRPIARVVVTRGRHGYTVKAYDGRGDLRSGIQAPATRAYVEQKIDEWWPGVPVEWPAEENPLLSSSTPLYVAAGAVAGFVVAGMFAWSYFNRPAAPVVVQPQNLVQPVDDPTLPWVPAQVLKPSQTYRASTDPSNYLTRFFEGITNFTIYTDHDPLPVGWPEADLDPGEVAGQPGKRFRVDAVSGPDPGALPSLTALGVRLAGDTIAGNITEPQALAIIEEYKNLRVYVPGPFGSGATDWILVPIGSSVPANSPFRVSFDVRASLSYLGIQLWTPNDAGLPADWPADDTQPGVWRVQGVWSPGATEPTLGTTFSSDWGAKVWVQAPLTAQLPTTLTA